MAEISPATVVAFGAEADIPQIDVNAQTLANHLKEVNKQTTGERTFQSFLQKTGEQPTYLPTQGILIESKFGAGAVTVNEQGQTEIYPNATLEQKANIELGKKLVEDNNLALDYLELLTEPNARAQEQKLTRMKSEKRSELRGITKYTELRQKALDIILTNTNSRDILEEIPELASTSSLSLEQKRVILEVGIAKDPTLKKSLSQEMNSIKDATKNLPEITTDGEKKKLEDQKKEATEKFNDDATSVVTLLKRTYADYGDIVTEEMVKKVLDESLDRDVALKTLMKQICFKIGLTDDQIKNISTYNQGQTRIEELNKILLASPTWEGTNAKKAYEKTTKEITEKTAEVDVIAKTSGFNDSLDKYQTLARALDGISVKTSDGIDQSMAINDLKTKIDKAPNADTKLQQLDRLVEESRILGQLEGAIGRAMADTLDARRTKMIELQDKDLKEKAEKDKTGAIKKVAEAQRKDEIEDDERNRTRIIHADTIGDKVRYLSYHVDDGIKRLMLKDLAFPNISWRTVDLDSGLSSEQKVQLDAAYTTADTYRDKLMTNYFTAVQLGGGFGMQRLFKGVGRELSRDLKIGEYKDIRWDGSAANLTFRDHEWKALDQKFGKQIDEALSKSKEGSDCLKQLKEKGIVPSFKLKWLLYILLALGLLVGGTAILGAAAK